MLRKIREEDMRGYVVLLVSLMLAFSGLFLAIIAEQTTEVLIRDSGLIEIETSGENVIYPPDLSEVYISRIKNTTLILRSASTAKLNVRLSGLNITYVISLEPRKNKTIILGYPQIVYLSLNDTDQAIVSVFYVYRVEAYIKKNLWLSIPAAILAFTGMGLAYIGLTKIFLRIKRTKRKPKTSLLKNIPQRRKT